jgi:hypothetical protein
MNKKILIGIFAILFILPFVNAQTLLSSYSGWDTWSTISANNGEGSAGMFFTINQSAILEKVSVLGAWYSGGTTCPINVNIYNVSAGNPDSIIYSFADIPYTYGSTSPQWLNSSGNFTIQANTIYGVTFGCIGTGSNKWKIYVNGSTSNAQGFYLYPTSVIILTNHAYNYMLYGELIEEQQPPTNETTQQSTDLLGVDYLLNIANWVIGILFILFIIFAFPIYIFFYYVKKKK